MCIYTHANTCIYTFKKGRNPLLPILKAGAGKCLTQIVAFLSALMALKQNMSSNHCFGFLSLHSSVE